MKCGLYPVIFPQLINVRAQTQHPSRSGSVLSAQSVVFQLPGHELGTARSLCFHLSAVLSPNIAHPMEWNPKEIEVNSFLLEFLCLWSCSQCWCEPWFNRCILSLTLTSSQTPFPRAFPCPAGWVTWFASRQKTITLSLSTPQFSHYPYLQLHISDGNTCV